MTKKNEVETTEEPEVPETTEEEPEVPETTEEVTDAPEPEEVEPTPEESAADTETPGTPAVRYLAAGTKVMIASQEVVLAEPAVVQYDRAGDEQYFASLCRLSGNYDVNRHFLDQHYDHNAVPVMPDPE